MKLRLAFALLVATVTLGMPRASQAMDRNVRIVLTAGTYGLAGGTVLGLASLPFSQNTRTVFIGSSVGMYLGLAVGIYYVWDKLYANPQAYRTRLYDSAAPVPERSADILARAGAREQRVQVPLARIEFN